MEYYTIDFETANCRPTSACSIGITGVKDGKVSIKKYYLINPQEPFDDYTISIHHITPDDVKDAPTFDVIWNEIKHYFTNTIVFSHNSMFDFGVLKSLLEKYRLEKPIFRFGCTVRMSRLLWPTEIPNHRLDTIARYLDVQFDHHNALSDASVCVEIINRGMKIYQIDDIISFYDALELRFGYFGPHNYYNTYQLKQRTRKQLPKVYNELLLNQVIVISGKPNIMRKQEFINRLIANGGYVDSLVTNKCNYFVKLNNYKEEKEKQVQSLINNGLDIKIVTEEEILKMVK